MADATAATLRGIDMPRQLPDAIRDRLEQTITANSLAPNPENFPLILDRQKRVPHEMRARLEELLLQRDADSATLMSSSDALRSLPAAAVERREPTRLPRNTLRRVYQMLGAAAVAMLIVAGSVFLAANRASNPEAPGAQGSDRAITTITPTIEPPTAPPSPSRPTVLGTKLIRTSTPSPAPERARGGAGSSSGSEVPGPASNSTSQDQLGFDSPRHVSRASRESAPDVSDQGLVGSVTTLVSDLLQELGLPPRIGTALEASPPPVPSVATVNSPPSRSFASTPSVRHHRRIRHRGQGSRTHTRSGSRSTGTSTDSNGSLVRVHLVPIIGSGGAQTQTLSISAAGLNVSL
ncbi:MAG: hypothetical protein NVSMB57_11870 [Actinomycetota bacterium]